MKVVINTTFRGLTLSEKALKFLNLNKDESKKFWNDRSNPDLIKAFEVIGNDIGVWDHHAFKILDIPDGVKYEIGECDVGGEYVREIPRMWC